MTTHILEHANGQLQIEDLETGKKRLKVLPHSKDFYVARYSWDTAYPLELIQLMLDTKGLGWVVDEIMREEDPRRRLGLQWDLLSYIGADAFRDKRILDFGCGSGASTVNLARLFPDADIVGVDLVPEVLPLGAARAQWYGYPNVSFCASPDPETLPEGLGMFDYVVLTALFEHLLPNERSLVLPMLWAALKPGGVLFLRCTPYRYSPIESHTTGLPFINYLPDRLTMAVVKRFTNFAGPDTTWEELLREGIRGGTGREIMRILNTTPDKPILLDPCQHGMKDRIDVWLVSKKTTQRQIMATGLKIVKALTGATILPYLTLAMQKSN